MIFLEKEFDLGFEDSQTHLRIPFNLKENYQEMTIKFDYSPRLASEEFSAPLVEESVEKFYPKELREEVKEGMQGFQIENFITTSLIYEEKFIGAWHNKSNNQEIKISKDFSSLGYKKHDILPGNYELTLSIHSANCPIKDHLALEMK